LGVPDRYRSSPLADEWLDARNRGRRGGGTAREEHHDDPDGRQRIGDMKPPEVRRPTALVPLSCGQRDREECAETPPVSEARRHSAHYYKPHPTPTNLAILVRGIVAGHSTSVKRGSSNPTSRGWPFILPEISDIGHVHFPLVLLA